MATPLRALIIEDSQSDAELILLELRQGGFEPTYERVETAYEMTDALRRQTWDVILADYTLPKFSAPEALTLLKKTGRDIPLLIISGSIGEETAVAAMKAGAHDYLMKDNLTRLPAAIQRELREAENRAERKSLEKQLLQAQKMESLGQLASGISHDFNNVLTGILGYSDLGLAKINLGHPLYSNFITIRKLAERAAGITRQLLAFARRQTIEAIDLNLNAIISDLLKLIATTLGEDIRIKFTPDAALKTVHADIAQIEQVLMNLCVNARDAMPQGGALTIETKNIHLEKADCLALPNARPGSYVLLEVIDTGTGMEEKVREKIFEPFFTTKSPGKGTGLGLSLVYGIVRQHHGTIQVQSAPGKGTAFKVYFPSVEKPAIPKPSPPSLPPRGSGTILVVEDDPAVRNLIKLVLDNFGYAVLAADSVKEGLKIFQAHSDSITLILSDMVMPEASGMDLFRKIQELKQNVPFLFISGHFNHFEDPDFLLRNNFHLLEKPFSPSELAAKVDAILRKK